MYQTKYFDAANINTMIDDKVNSWLAEHPNLEILDVKYTCDHSGFSTVFIIYWVGDEEENAGVH